MSILPLALDARDQDLSSNLDLNSPKQEKDYKDLANEVSDFVNEKSSFLAREIERSNTSNLRDEWLGSLATPPMQD